MTGAVPEVRMATDILRQFPTASHEEVATLVTGHIVKFWDPRMRARLVAQDVADHEFGEVLATVQSRLRGLSRDAGIDEAPRR